MTAATSDARPRVFYGWWIVASLGLILFLSAGFGFYAIGVFITPLEEAFGWSRGQVSLAMALAQLFNGFSGLVVGALVNRVGVRVILAGGALLMGLALALLSLTWSLLYLYPLFILMGVGQAGIMLIPITTVVSNWFRRKRGLAMGLTTAGIGLGGLVMAPLAALLIGGLGWRATFLIMGLVVIAVGLPVAAFVVRQHPRDSGLLPDGDAAYVDTDDLPARADAEDDHWTVRQAVRTRAFFAVVIAFSLTMACVSSVLLHIVPFLEDRDISRQQAGLMLGFVSGMGVLGKVSSGYLTDVVSPRIVVSAVFALLAVGLVVLLQFDSVWGMALFTIIFGFSMGSVVALQPLMIVYCFGAASVATILGAAGVITWSVNALGPMLAGLMYDLTGTYGPVFLGFAAADVAAAAIIFFFGHPPRQEAAQRRVIVAGAQRRPPELRDPTGRTPEIILSNREATIAARYHSQM